MMTSELLTRRSAIAVATVVESKIVPQSANGKLVVIIVDFLSCRALMTWKKRLEPWLPRGRYPISSIANTSGA